MSKEIENFMRACRTGNVDKLEKAIAKGIDLESLDENKITGLIWAGNQIYKTPNDCKTPND